MDLLVLLFWLFVGVAFLLTSLKKNPTDFEKRKIYKPPKIYTAEWASDEDIYAQGMFATSGIRLGYSSASGLPIYSHNKTNYTLVGPPGTGKSSAIIEALLTFPGAVMVISPDAELTVVTAAQRARFGPVEIIDFDNMFPRQLARYKHSTYNFMNPHFLPKDDRMKLDLNSAALAQSLIFQNAATDRYFYENATRTLRTVILFLALYGQPGEVNPRRLLSIFSGNVFQWAKKAWEIATDPDLLERLEALALSEHVKSMGEVIETIRVELEFLSYQNVAKAFSGDGTSFASLKEQPKSIYINYSTKNGKAMNKPIRTLLGCALSELRDRGNVPILIVVDEAYQIGRLEEIVSAYAGLRKHKVSLWLAWQDLNQMKAIYPEWESLISSSGVTQIVGCNDKFSSEYISALSGSAQYINYGKNYGIASKDGGQTIGDIISIVQRPLIFPHEVIQMSEHQQLLFIPKKPPIFAFKLPYWKSDLARLASPNPFVEE